MGGELIRVEQSLLKGIENNYKNCAKIIGEITKEINRVNSVYESHYKGKASNAISDGFPEILKHLNLLKDCYSKTAEYVNYTYEYSSKSEDLLSKALRSV